MIRHQYSSAVEFSVDDDFLDHEINGACGVELGKRKFISNTDDDSQLLALSKLEDLDIGDSDDEDIILLEDLEGVQELLGVKDEPSEEKQPVIKLDDAKMIVRHIKNDIQNGTDAEPPSENCQMRWLRTVGMDHTGKLKCVVSSGAIDTASESGKSGKTESVMADTIRGLVNVYQKKRAEIITKDGIVPTPLHVVKCLANEHGETLHCEATSFANGFHRVELFSGSIRGLGEGVTKKIAAQMAAIDMIERIQLSEVTGRTVKIPPVAFLPGWLTSNRVFIDLREYCKKFKLPPPKISSDFNLNEQGLVDPKRPKYRAQCWVGEEYATVGESEVDIFARREAAREMILLITSEEYKDTPYAIGTACKTVNELTAAGFPMIMSDYKKVWLARNRIQDNKLMIPEDEKGMDEPFDVAELLKSIENLDETKQLMMTNQKIKVRVGVNKKVKFVEDESKALVRRISVESATNEMDEDEF